MLGIRETMQAGRRDLEAFEVAPNGEPKTLVIFDTMPGGTGYLPKLLAEGGAGLREVASTALERLGGCDCEKSCHRCLRDFWNQRHHRVLDRHAVIGTLRHLRPRRASTTSPSPTSSWLRSLSANFFNASKQPASRRRRYKGSTGSPTGASRWPTPSTRTRTSPCISTAASITRNPSTRIRADLHRRNQLEQQWAARPRIHLQRRDGWLRCPGFFATRCTRGRMDRSPATAPDDDLSLQRQTGTPAGWM